jgi:hypothetical protein
MERANDAAGGEMISDFLTNSRTLVKQSARVIERASLGLRCQFSRLELNLPADFLRELPIMGGDH